MDRLRLTSFPAGPDRLIRLSRRAPLIWVFAAVFYPMLSMYPQELVFRAFLMHWYGPA
jgi:uncharacterized protein